MFKEGDRVRHEDYGDGTVISISDVFAVELCVEFDNAKEDVLHNGQDCSHKGGKPNCCYFFSQDDEELQQIGGADGGKSNM